MFKERADFWTKYVAEHCPEPDDLSVFKKSDLANCYEPLKLVNWVDAPENAEEMLITVHWADKDSNIIKQVILVQESRP
jgi:hypothetical protein